MLTMAGIVMRVDLIKGGVSVPPLNRMQDNSTSRRNIDTIPTLRISLMPPYRLLRQSPSFHLHLKTFSLQWQVKEAKILLS